MSPTFWNHIIPSRSTVYNFALDCSPVAAFPRHMYRIKDRTPPDFFSADLASQYVPYRYALHFSVARAQKVLTAFYALISDIPIESMIHFHRQLPIPDTPWYKSYSEQILQPMKCSFRCIPSSIKVETFRLCGNFSQLSVNTDFVFLNRQTSLLTSHCRNYSLESSSERNLWIPLQWFI